MKWRSLSESFSSTKTIQLLDTGHWKFMRILYVGLNLLLPDVCVFELKKPMEFPFHRWIITNYMAYYTRLLEVFIRPVFLNLFRQRHT